jgi:catechol 2,3-dioxygenase-like lactoylglutathione lyase family enzyme
VTVVGLHHAGVYVSDLARSIAFYCEAFGLEVAETLTFEGEQIAFLRLGSARLELIEGGPARGGVGGVVDHVALQVLDLGAMVARLRAQDVPLLDEAPVPVAGLRARILFCLGPDGERIELFEYDSRK